MTTRAIPRQAAGTPQQPEPAPGIGGSLSRPLLTMSLLLAALTTTTSLLGLLAPWPYAAETANWRLQAQAQDLGNLLAVGVLLIAAIAARRGSVRGFLAWAGSLLYLAYAFTIYAMTVHFGPLFLPYVAGLGLSAYCLVFGLPGRTVGLQPRHLRLGSWTIGVTATLFALLWLAGITAALGRGEVPPELTDAGLVANPVHVLDLALVLPAMLITAVLARRDDPAGTLLLAPWLTFSALMGASILAALLLTAAPVAVLAALGAVLRGAEPASA